MPTTCGALPWSDAKSTKNADVIEKLLEAGVIILGKGNLSVCFHSFKTKGTNSDPI